MILRDLLQHATRDLAAAGFDGAAGDARRLLAHAAGVPPERLSLHIGDPVEPGVAERLADALARRRTHQPVAQITGTRLFWGRAFLVTPDVLDPRPETETLISLALEGPRPNRLLDLGTGSGCLAATLLAEWPASHGVATDISATALAVAARNADGHGVADRLTLRMSNWWANLEGRFDLIVSNPPYIAEAEMADLAPDVRDWEPHLALTPGGDGLGAYREIAARLDEFLTPNGRALFEIGASQSVNVSAIFAASGQFQVRVHADLDGRDRVVEVRHGE